MPTGRSPAPYHGAGWLTDLSSQSTASHTHLSDYGKHLAFPAQTPRLPRHLSTLLSPCEPPPSRPNQILSPLVSCTVSQSEFTFFPCLLCSHDPFIEYSAAAAAKSLQSCPTLCDPTDGSPPGCPVPGILQARTLEWAAISYSNAGKCKKWSRSVLSDSLGPHGLQPTRLPRPWDSPGKSTGVGCHFLLQCRKVKRVKSLSHVRLFGAPWTAAHQAAPSLGFSRQEYWRRVPVLSPEYCTV